MIEGETYNIIVKSKCGLVCKSGDFKSLSKNVNKIINYSKEKKKNGDEWFQIFKYKFQ